MLPLGRIALCVMLLADISPLAGAQSAGQFISHSQTQNIFYSNCDRTELLAPISTLLSTPPMRPPGLNIDSACLASRRIKLLEIDRRTFERDIRYPNWPPKFCGMTNDGNEPIWVCVKGLGHSARILSW